MRDDETSRTLQKAADHIETYGLHKGDNFADFGHKETSAVCIYGALSLYAQSDDYRSWKEAARRVRSILHRSTLSQWNDAPETTQEMVVDLLRKAANV